ncbi:hypothetical protein BgiBS90_008740 [Biomphalaria glabrata]|nr:hypothetical protein BgiBS90_008740 [Biomphalaria glabrata]
MDMVAAYVRRIFVNVTRGRGSQNVSKTSKTKKRDDAGEKVASAAPVTAALAANESVFSEAEDDEVEYPDVFDDETFVCCNNDIDSLQRGECIKILPRSSGSSNQVCWTDDLSGIVDLVPTYHKVSVYSFIPSDAEPDDWTFNSSRNYSAFSDSEYSEVQSGTESRKLSVVSGLSDADFMFEDACEDQTEVINHELSIPAFNALIENRDQCILINEPRGLNLHTIDTKGHPRHIVYQEEVAGKHQNIPEKEKLISEGRTLDTEEMPPKHSSTPAKLNADLIPEVCNDVQQRRPPAGAQQNMCDCNLNHSLTDSVVRSSIQTQKDIEGCNSLKTTSSKDCTISEQNSENVFTECNYCEHFNSSVDNCQIDGSASNSTNVDIFETLTSGLSPDKIADPEVIPSSLRGNDIAFKLPGPKALRTKDQPELSAIKNITQNPPSASTLPCKDNLAEVSKQSADVFTHSPVTKDAIVGPHSSQHQSTTNQTSAIVYQGVEDQQNSESCSRDQGLPNSHKTANCIREESDHPHCCQHDNENVSEPQTTSPYCGDNSNRDLCSAQWNGETLSETCNNTESLERLTICSRPACNNTESLEGPTTCSRPACNNTESLEGLTICSKPACNNTESLEGLTTCSRPACNNTESLEGPTTCSRPACNNTESLEGLTICSRPACNNTESLEGPTTCSRTACNNTESLEEELTVKVPNSGVQSSCSKPAYNDTESLEELTTCSRPASDKNDSPQKETIGLSNSSTTTYNSSTTTYNDDQRTGTKTENISVPIDKRSGLNNTKTKITNIKTDKDMVQTNNQTIEERNHIIGNDETIKDCNNTLCDVENFNEDNQTLSNVETLKEVNQTLSDVETLKEVNQTLSNVETLKEVNQTLSNVETLKEVNQTLSNVETLKEVNQTLSDVETLKEVNQTLSDVETLKEVNQTLSDVETLKEVNQTLSNVETLKEVNQTLSDVETLKEVNQTLSDVETLKEVNQTLSDVETLKEEDLLHQRDGEVFIKEKVCRSNLSPDSNTSATLHEQKVFLGTKCVNKETKTLSNSTDCAQTNKDDVDKPNSNVDKATLNSNIGTKSDSNELAKVDAELSENDANLTNTSSEHKLDNNLIQTDVRIIIETPGIPEDKIKQTGTLEINMVNKSSQESLKSPPLAEPVDFIPVCDTDMSTISCDYKIFLPTDNNNIISSNSASEPSICAEDRRQSSTTLEIDQCDSNYYTLGIPLSLSGSDIVVTSGDSAEVSAITLSDESDSSESEKEEDEAVCSESNDSEDVDDIIFVNFVSPSANIPLDLIPRHPTLTSASRPKKPELDYTCFFDDQLIEEDENSSSYESGDDDDDSSEEEFVNVMKNTKLKVLPVIYEDDADHLQSNDVSDEEELERFEDALSFNLREPAGISPRFKDYLIVRSIHNGQPHRLSEKEEGSIHSGQPHRLSEKEEGSIHNGQPHRLSEKEEGSIHNGQPHRLSEKEEGSIHNGQPHRLSEKEEGSIHSGQPHRLSEKEEGSIHNGQPHRLSEKEEGSIHSGQPHRLSEKEEGSIHNGQPHRLSEKEEGSIHNGQPHRLSEKEEGSIHSGQPHRLSEKEEGSIHNGQPHRLSEKEEGSIHNGQPQSLSEKEKGSSFLNDELLKTELKSNSCIRTQGSNGKHCFKVNPEMSKLLKILSLLGMSRDLSHYLPVTSLRSVIRIQYRQLGLIPGKNLTTTGRCILSKSALHPVFCVLEQVREHPSSLTLTLDNL